MAGRRLPCQACPLPPQPWGGVAAKPEGVAGAWSALPQCLLLLPFGPPDHLRAGEIRQLRIRPPDRPSVDVTRGLGTPERKPIGSPGPSNPGLGDVQPFGSPTKAATGSGYRPIERPEIEPTTQDRSRAGVETAWPRLSPLGLLLNLRPNSAMGEGGKGGRGSRCTPAPVPLSLSPRRNPSIATPLEPGRRDPPPKSTASTEIPKLGDVGTWLEARACPLAARRHAMGGVRGQPGGEGWAGARALGHEAPGSPAPALLPSDQPPLPIWLTDCSVA
jgi:hypothetical protein